jgi:Cu/Ag efflux pump CusA
MRDYGKRVSGDLLAIPGVIAVSQRIGRDPTDDDSWGPERGSIDLALDQGLSATGQETVARRVKDTLALYPGVQGDVRSRFDFAQNPGAAAPFEVGLYGSDLDVLDDAATRTAARLRALPGARQVRLGSQARAPAVRIDLNLQRMALYGLSAADVLDTVQAAFQGERVAQIYDGERVVDIAVSAQASLRQDPEAVGNLLVRSTAGISEPLKSVANVYLTDARASIAHDNGLRSEVISADPAPSDRVRFDAAARTAISGKAALPPGVFAEFAGADRAAADAQREFLSLYAISLFGVVALLALAFDGRSAAVILASTLFSLVGAAAAVALLGRTLSVGAGAGVISLFGVSMRGAILLLTRVEDLAAARQAPWSPAIVAQAARERLTPTLMTSLLVALGLAPLAIHAGDAGREILGPMAIVIIGGLITGTLGSVLALPALVFAFWRPGLIRHGRRARQDASGRFHQPPPSA